MATENPAAFPSVCLGDPGHPASVSGMTLRDWFAGQALPSTYDYAAANISQGMDMGHLPEEWAARIAYALADAMLAARAAPTGDDA